MRRPSRWPRRWSRVGAAAAITGALMTLAQRDLRGFYRGTTVAHGGMLLAALGTAPLGNFAAALLVAVTIGLALGGLGMMITALEERVGDVAYARTGRPRRRVPAAGGGVRHLRRRRRRPAGHGRLRRRRPAAAHAVARESDQRGAGDPDAAVLAVATLIVFSKVFLGRTVPSLAPDLYRRERVVAVPLLLSTAHRLGVAPGLLLGPADAFLSAAPPGSSRGLRLSSATRNHDLSDDAYVGQSFRLCREAALESRPTFGSVGGP